MQATRVLQRAFPSWLLYTSLFIALISLTITNVPTPLDPLATVTLTYDANTQKQKSLYETDPFVYTNHSAIFFKDAEVVFQNSALSAEHIVVSSDGKRAYTGLRDGRIVYFHVENVHEGLVNFTRIGKDISLDSEKECGSPQDEAVCGRALGMAFASASLFDSYKSDLKSPSYYPGKQLLLVADAYRGLFLMDAKGKKTLLFDSVNNGTAFVKIKFLNSIAVATKRGVVYLTVTSSIFGRNQVILDVLKGEATGMLLEFNPKKKKITILKDKLCEPNGIVLTENEDFLLISLTNANKIIRYTISDQTIIDFAFAAGKSDNLEILKIQKPNHPPRDVLLIGVTSPHQKCLQWIWTDKTARKILYLLPSQFFMAYLRRVSSSFTIVDIETGDLMYVMVDPLKRNPFTSGVQKIGEYLYLTSWNHVSMLRVPLQAIQRL
uniref:Uncharacterized protein AlNc14C4G541 n=1 Tax=Albugo laibachii Nc14 TaxID=890382 RepID=F0W099_9STRA|nr:conserved hypothetical protein [Albugo laibachii Nc14]|eukprot:CCA14470.1 conserved hypothetical protein [Albugo laibachii Nc14]